MTEVRRSNPPPATLDHLVVAATTLADGIDFVAERTGAIPQPGGKHVAMGTHNALLRLGERVYLEIIAIDPEGTKPLRPRWFDLDDIALQSDGKRPAKRIGPTLIQWDVPMHPADGLPASKVSIAQVAGTHSDPAHVRSALASLGLAESVRVSYDRETRFAAMLQTPRGLVTL